MQELQELRERQATQATQRTQGTRATRWGDEMETHNEGNGKMWLGAVSTGESTQMMCQGCRERPDRACAACGARASVWTDAGDGRHAVAWCAACHEMLLSGRPTNAQPLVYLDLGVVCAPV